MSGWRGEGGLARAGGMDAYTHRSRHTYLAHGAKDWAASRSAGGEGAVVLVLLLQVVLQMYSSS